MIIENAGLNLIIKTHSLWRSVVIEFYKYIGN
jgi:hypothetical protein